MITFLFVSAQIAVRALNRNRMRTVLTMLGVVIGVAAVIAMVALGTGARGSVASTRRVSPAAASAISLAARITGSGHFHPLNREAISTK